MPSQVTEREIAGALAEELNKFIQKGGIPFEKATVEHRAGRSYPDITIWTNFATGQAFAIWELKRPGLKEDLSKLPGKAQSLKARYVVVWNFQHGELYKVDQGALRSLKSYPQPLLTSLDEWGIVPKRIDVLNQACGILDDLSRLAQGQSLTPFVPDKFFFINTLRQAIHRLHPALQNRLFQAKKDKDIRSRIDAWAVKQGYPLSLIDLDNLLARHWAYSLSVRILFYFTVCRYHPGFPNLRSTPGDAQPLTNALQEAFSKAQSVDWQAVFENSPLDDLGLPPDIEPILRELLDNFHQYNFGQLKEDVIGQIMEGLIPEEERHALGQYFTREDVIDLIIGFVANKDQAFYLDPTCGSGTFLNRLYSRLRWLSTYRATHSDLLGQLWGVDIAHFPAELATINLFRQDASDFSNFPRIVVRDFFTVRPNQTFSFPPLRITGTEYKKIEIQLPDLHGIVGNFPYIRQELIERQNPGYKKSIVLVIAQEWFWKDQDLFKVKGIPSQDIEQVRQKSPVERRDWLKEQVDRGRVDLRLSGQADIYAYLFFHAAAFLEERGRLGIVTSNAWLDVAYGEELKRFFLRHFKIIAIVASWCEPWFEDAAVNTAFIILERCENRDERARNVVRFVKVKKPLSNLLPRDLLLQEAIRWQKVDTLVRQIELADTKVAHWDPDTGQMLSLKGIHTEENDDVRIRLVSQAELEAELQARGPMDKWGLYIRAPKVYFNILQIVGKKLIPLSQIAKVRFGVKTGINDFFYLELLNRTAQSPGAVWVKNARGWEGEIEETCLQPVIKSPKEAKGLVVDPSTLKYRLFLPPIDLSSTNPDQALQRYPLANQYVAWGKQQRTDENQPWPQVPSVQGRKAWWFIGKRDSADFLTMGFVNRRFFVLENVPDVFASDVMFEWRIESKEIDKEVVMALLNSTLTYICLEIIRRQNLGDGVLKIIGPELFSLHIPDPRMIQPEKQQEIVRRFDKLKKRSIKPIEEEVKQADRRALDEATLDALELDPKKYLPLIYKGLVEMVKERLNLPKMRTTRKMQAKRLSIAQVKERIRQDVLPAGLKSIEAFLPPGSKPQMMTIPLTGRPVSWQPFLTELVLVDEKDNEVGKLTGGEETARYIIYGSKPGQYGIEAPTDRIVVGQGNTGL